MNNFYKLCIAIIVSLLNFQITIFPQSSKQSADSNQVKKHNPSDCSSMIEFFVTSVLVAGKTGEIVLLNNSCPDEITFPPLNGNKMSIVQKMDLIIQKYPAYKWKEEQGTIRLLPAKGIPKLLKTKIKDVTITFKNYLGIVSDIVLRSPEVIKQEKKLQISEGMYYGGLVTPPNKLPPTVMDFHHKTLEEILNQVARKHGSGIWLYREGYYFGANHFTINFIAS